ncbi:DNA-binding response regulator [Kocuria dechangensis]|uniref:DNA-binding response regulator n=1 Tax=Kocuria dechangensis TaxID=1176249 RepID=A0A917H2Y5_9MICC|nr:response regulator transcription factor [Kocuria dechangensis]GGG65733.1 DNA-binding response regulator [Kocuria dechangensis]
MNASVLVVEDDPHIARALLVNLKARGYRTHHAATGRAALEIAAHEHPDVILLDLGLPDMEGRQVIEGIRGWSQVPIMVVSARGESHSKVDALDRGADDYVAKPFAMDELLARLRAALRRAQPDPVQAVVTTSDGRVSIDLASKSVTVEGTPVRLTKLEWRLLEVLARNTHRLIGRTELLTTVWGPEYGEEANYLRVYISQLRSKLEPDPSHPRYFLTELGMGYRFTP